MIRHFEIRARCRVVCRVENVFHFDQGVIVEWACMPTTVGIVLVFLLKYFRYRCIEYRLSLLHTTA